MTPRTNSPGVPGVRLPATGATITASTAGIDGIFQVGTIGYVKQLVKMPGGMVIWLVLGLVGLWLLSGIYIVNPDEEGVVLRFGKYDRTEAPAPITRCPLPSRPSTSPR